MTSQSAIDAAEPSTPMIVMEGVENRDEVEILRGFNCDVIQGYVFARPAPASQALVFARDRSAKAGAPGILEVASEPAIRRTLSAAG